MSKEQHADSEENPPKRRQLSDSVLVEAVRNGDTTAVRVGLEKLNPDTDTDSKTVAFDAVHEACRGNHDECLALLLPYVETTQMGFGILLSECVHADHTACTEVLLQHWKSVCSNVAFVPHGQEADNEDKTPRPCPAMWADPAVCQVLIDAGADIETKDEDGRSPLLRASISGKSAAVKMLVEAGADVCVTDKQGDTCLTLASCFGQTENVRYLVGLKEVDVNHTSEDGYTVLHCAGENNYPVVCQVLIDAGADIETKENKGRPPLHKASSSGALNVVKVLVEAGADVCVTDNTGRTCLIFAAMFGHTETVRYLVGLKDVDVNYSGYECCSALSHAVVGNHADVVQVLIDAGADIETQEKKGRSPLHKASSSGALNVVKVLVEAGADVCVTDNLGRTCVALASHLGHTETVRYLAGLKEVDLEHADSTGRTALSHAVVANHADVVEVLIAAGADIETRDNHDRTPLLVASQCGNLRVVEVFAKAGADVCVTDNKRRTCLTLAAASGHTETVRYLTGLEDVGVNHSGDEGCTALHWASKKSYPEVVQVLIDAGADIEAKEEKGRSPLHKACMSGHLDIVKLLVRSGAGVRATDNKGVTCLIGASYLGHTETVRYLVGLKDVDINHVDSTGCTALRHAAVRNHADAVQVLIDAGADIEVKDEEGRSPLLVSNCLGHLDIAIMLVKAGADVCVTDNKGRTCLTLASYYGHTETVHYLVGLKEVDVNHSGDEGFTALHWAGQKNHPEVVQVLIDAGADFEAKEEEGRSPLHKACNSGHLDIVKLLVRSGAGVRATDNKGVTCLIGASYLGHTETVRYLVGLKEVDINHVDSTGCTALRHAAVRNHADAVEVLIDAGADIEVKDEEGRSPLLVSNCLGHLDIAIMLVKAGADVCVTDNKGRTCFALASYYGHTETVRYLAGLKEVDLEHADSTGRTALSHAVVANHADVVEVLIDAGADIETRGNHDRTPLLVASQCGNLQVVKVLVKAGADVCVTHDNGDTCLAVAAANGHSETVRTLLCLPEVDVNHSNNRGFTSLHRAVLKKHSDVVQLLIDAGADIEVKRDRISPLRCACDVGELDIVKMLVEAGVDVCEVDNKGNTCLIIAAHFGHTETVRYLVGLPEVDVNHRNVSGLTALQHASHKQHADVVQILFCASGKDIFPF